jgi:glycosyltransferase involved in cell wall biosynthesis
MQSDSSQLVSVIVPVYNTARYLAECLQSILAQDTTYQLEVIVVDDASTDGSADIAREFGEPVRVVTRPHRGGAAAARNEGLRLTHGTYLAFLDSDDRWTSNKLQKQLPVLNSRSDVDIILGMVRQFISPEVDDSLRERLVSFKEVLPGFSLGSMLVRRSDFLNVGELCTSLNVGEFIDWFSRARQKGLRFVLIEDIVLERRIHSNNTMLKSTDVHADYLKIVRRNLFRKKKKSGGNGDGS